MDPLHPAVVFDALADACVIFDRDLTVREANAAYLAVLGASRDELVGTHVRALLDAREDDPGAGDRVVDAYRTVLRDGGSLQLGVLRYDFPDPVDPAALARRYWTVTVTALTDEAGVVVGLLHRARDVTETHLHLLRAVALHRSLPRDAATEATVSTDATGPVGTTEPADGPDLAELTEQSLHTSQLAAALTREVAQLREAMFSRAGIEQAKGILMGQRGIGPDEAFALLARLSQDSNRKLRDVAAVVVESALEAGGEQPAQRDDARETAHPWGA